jgi:hypothetical protein
VVCCTRHDDDLHFPAGRDFKGDACSSGLQFRQLRLGMTYSFRKYAHAVTGLNDFIKLFKRTGIIDLLAEFGARIHGHCTHRIHRTTQQGVSPKFRACHEVQRPTFTPRSQQPSVHERVGVITRKNNRVSSGDVFQANDVNSPKKRVGDGANQQLDELP